MDRFLDEDKIIKKKPIEESIEEPIKEQIEKPIEKPAKNISDKKQIRKRSKKQVKDTVKTSSDSQESTKNDYFEEANKIMLEENLSLPKQPGVTIEAVEKKQDKPVYEVSRENGGVTVETPAFKQQNSVVTKVFNKKDIMIDMRNDINQQLLEKQVELELDSRMMQVIDAKYRASYESKLNALKDKIKELGLKASILDNMISGR